jgi:hypothetical protein
MIKYMKQISISDETYAKLVRAGELTHHERLAEAILFRMASETVRIMESDAAKANAVPRRFQ